MTAAAKALAAVKKVNVEHSGNIINRGKKSMTLLSMALSLPFSGWTRTNLFKLTNRY